MKVAVIHPLRHHAYYALEAALYHCPDSVMFCGYFNTGDLIDRIIYLTPFGKMLGGYRNDKLKAHVKVKIHIKLLFLLFKFCPKIFEKMYFHSYQKWCIQELSQFDCIYVLQDYCNDVIREAIKTGIKIVYDQIIAFDYERFITDECINNAERTKKLHMQAQNLGYATRVIAPSKFVVNSMLGYSFSDSVISKVKLIQYGGNVNLYKFKYRHLNFNECIRVLFVGSLTRRKGIEYLLNAMEELNNFNIELTIVGACVTDSKPYIERIEKLPNVRYCGTVPHERMNDLYLKYHIFLLPSLAEGSSLSVFEALASGLPCIVTENAGSTVRHDIDGILIKTKSTDSIKNALLEIIENPHIINNMSKAARNNAELYSWERFSTEVKDVLDEISAYSSNSSSFT